MADRALGGRNQNIVVGDPLDPPGLNPEGEGVAHRSFPDELLVEFAEKGAAALDPQLIVAAVGDGPSREIDEPLDPGSGADRAVDGVDADQRSQAADPAAGVAAGEHLEDEIEVAAGEVVVGVRAANGREELVRAPVVRDHHGEQHLGEDIEGAGDRFELLDLAVEDAFRHHRRFEEIPAEQRHEASPTGLADAVARSAEPLQGRCDRWRRLDHDDLVDGADVDPEFEGTGGDDGLEFAVLEALFDDRADLARERRRGGSRRGARARPR